MLFPFSLLTSLTDFLKNCNNFGEAKTQCFYLFFLSIFRYFLLNTLNLPDLFGEIYEQSHICSRISAE